MDLRSGLSAAVVDMTLTSMDSDPMIHGYDVTPRTRLWWILYPQERTLFDSLGCSDNLTPLRFKEDRTHHKSGLASFKPCPIVIVYLSAVKSGLDARYLMDWLVCDTERSPIIISHHSTTQTEDFRMFGSRSLSDGRRV